MLIDRLEKVAAGEIDRLLVCMPPGAAKSTYASVLFPSWLLANNPGASIIAASHTAELSERWGRRIRNQIAEDGETLGIALRADSQSAGRWQLEGDGEYLAAGVGQAILGFRADVALIDDPFRSREDAASESVRRSVWGWYLSDLKTRMKPRGRIIIITTRMHEDDLAGRVLAEMDQGGEHWDTLIIPATAEEGDPLGRKPGEYLWDTDAKYEYGDFLRKEHAAQPPMNWAAIFQQRPAPDSGIFFEAAWLKPYTKNPDLLTLRTYGGSDYAVTSKGGDHTVHMVVGIDPDWNPYLLDLWRGQTASDVWVERLLDMAKLWKPLTWAEESGQIRAAVGPLIDRRMAERGVYFSRKTFPTRGDKAVRAQPIRGRMAARGLYVPTKAPWYAAFLQELMAFPNGRNDDQVDALGLIGQLLAEIVPVSRPKPKRKEEREAYVEANDESEAMMIDRPWDIDSTVSMATV